jgi:signal transduction histidine kinase
LVRGLVTVWPALLTFVACTLATLGVWSLVEAYPLAHKTRTNNALAVGLRQAMQVRFEEHLNGIKLNAELWSRYPSADLAEWKARAQALIQEHPGVVLVSLVNPPGAEPTLPAAPVPAGDLEQTGGDLVRNVVDSDQGLALIMIHGEVRKWVVGPELSQRLEDARQIAFRDRAPVMDGPFHADSGQSFYQVLIPSELEGETPPLVCAWIQPSIVLSTLVSDAAPGFWVSVDDAGEQVYAQGAVPESAALDKEAVASLPMQLSLGPMLKVFVGYGPDMQESGSPSIGSAVFGVGLVFSVLLASVVYLGQASRIRARALQLANVELEKRIHSTAVAEEEVRRINESLEERVAERTRALDELVTELETFNYSVSHDLRSPIGAIVNFTSILAEDYREKLDAQGHDILRRVGGCAQTAVAMMDGLLAFSRIGQQSLTPSRVDMQQMVETVFAEQMLAHPGPPPTLSVGELPSVLADPVMMRTVWTNLISNAVKFTSGQDAPAIEVGSQSTADEGIFFVRDNGVGFEMQHATRLFTVFEQIHSRQRFKGHGVGLAIVSRIVRKHGGRVWAQSAPDKGATFYFSIPVAREES